MDYQVKVIFNQLKDFFAAVDHAFDGTSYEEKSRGIVALRAEVREKEEACFALKECLWSNDGAIRILAAEALSLASAFPLDTVPVLLACLQVGFDRKEFEKDEMWIGLALGALTNYGPLAIQAQAAVWPYLYVQTTETLQKMEIRYSMRIASTYDSAWAIACLLCHHENEVIRELARSIMSSEDFKAWK